MRDPVIWGEGEEESNQLKLMCVRERGSVFMCGYFDVTCFYVLGSLCCGVLGG